MWIFKFLGTNKFRNHSELKQPFYNSVFVKSTNKRRSRIIWAILRTFIPLFIKKKYSVLTPHEMQARFCELSQNVLTVVTIFFNVIISCKLYNL